MALTWRDAVSSALVAAIVVPYTWYENTGSAPLVRDPRGMAAIGLVLGIAACVVGARVNGERMLPAAQALGGLALVSGLLTLVIDAEWSLAVFMITVISLWLMTTLRRIPTGHRASTGGDRR
ncbi:hypothetical protein [Actinokineospora sp. HUAS TT18]|uniref:hypothetical protein n=1 Tax=Actinokineospora sp. HUAS TT18 TaxID=3447451 RepID=UPI003F51D6B5